MREVAATFSPIEVHGMIEGSFFCFCLYSDTYEAYFAGHVSLLERYRIVCM